MKMAFLLLRLELACELFQVDSFPKENCMCFFRRAGDSAHLAVISAEV